mgnify:CR=1 FL=1
MSVINLYDWHLKDIISCEGYCFWWILINLDSLKGLINHVDAAILDKVEEIICEFISYFEAEIVWVLIEANLYLT